MPSAFGAIMNRLDADLDAHLGENISLIPMKNGDFGRTPDPDRAVLDCVALVNEVDPSAADVGKMMVRVPYSEFELEVARSVLAGAKFKKDDEALLLDRDGSPRCVIVRVDDADRGRVCFICSMRGVEQ